MWTDLDLSALIPVDASIIVIRVRTTNDDGSAYGYGLRAKGSTDTRTGTVSGYGQCQYYCTVGTNRTIQYAKWDSTIAFQLVGYFTSDAVGFTNAVTVSTSIPDAWTTYDLSGSIPAGGKFAVLQIKRPGGAAAVSVRCNGSTDNRLQSATTGSLYGYCTGVDVNRKIQLYGSNMEVYLVGYVTQGRQRVNGLDKSLVDINTFKDVDVSADYPPWGCAGALVEYHCTTASARAYVLRAIGSTDNDYVNRRNTTGALCVKLDANRKFQFKMSAVDADIYILGYFMKPLVHKTQFAGYDIGEFKRAMTGTNTGNTQDAYFSALSISEGIPRYNVSPAVTDVFVRSMKTVLTTQLTMAYRNAFSLCLALCLRDVIGEILSLLSGNCIVSDVFGRLTPIPDVLNISRQTPSPMNEPFGFTMVNEISEGMSLIKSLSTQIADSGLLFGVNNQNACSDMFGQSLVNEISEGFTVIRTFAMQIVDSGLLFAQSCSSAIERPDKINLLQALSTKIADSDVRFIINNTNTLSTLSNQNILTTISEGLNLLQALSTKIADSDVRFTTNIITALGNSASQSAVNEISEGLNILRTLSAKIVDSGLSYTQSSPNALTDGITHQFITEISKEFRRAMSIITTGNEPIVMLQALGNEMVAMSALFAQYMNLNNDSFTLIQPDTDWDIIIDGISVKDRVLSIDVTCNETNYMDSIELTLVGVEDISGFDPDVTSESRTEERIELRLPAYSYHFLLESIEVKESFAKQGISLHGRQKTALLMEPFAEKVSQVYNNTLASAIAVELAGDIPITWAVDDYLISQMSIDGYPLEAIAELAGAMGGIVRTQKDGSLLVRARYPVRPDRLPTVAPTRIFDHGNIIAMDISQEQPLYSAVTVQVSKETAASKNYTMQTSGSCAESGQAVDIYIYKPNPAAQYRLKASGVISLTSKGQVVETVQEDIDLVGGSGSLSNPVFELVSYSIDGCSGNCELNYTPGDTSVYVDNASCCVLHVRYITKYDHWIATSDREHRVVICAVEDENAETTAVRCIKGIGSKQANDINNVLVMSPPQARIVGETYLNDNYYKKEKVKIKSVFNDMKDGDIVTVIDNNKRITGIVRNVDLSFTTDGNVLKFYETIEVYAYHEVEGAL
ncbi:MAG: hypothetical protein HQL61_09085 [Magnetococcales bacterium]|nr:hypothetical protein [Nitrospirota bacterium]